MKFSFYFPFLTQALWLGCVSSRKYPLLVISFDGLRADKLDAFLKENPTSSFADIVKTGVKAKYMTPAFPTYTIPNHLTLITGRKFESIENFNFFQTNFFLKALILNRMALWGIPSTVKYSCNANNS
jgi:hypothetical protein